LPNGLNDRNQNGGIMIEIVTGDLLEAKEKYILHQTNCISNGGAAGIARAIFDKYPYADCYSSRTQTSIPGTIDICGNGADQRFIVNLHGQYYPGRAQYPLSSLDGLAAREKYFYRGLLRVAQLPNLESIGLNWRIGCGIAGGSWEHYLGTITNFANHVEETQGAKVIIYRRDGDE
jgi:O-acetyl-ADP-ribose deacetylase (regulator of RNase III)